MNNRGSGFVIAWVALCVALGCFVGWQVAGLRELTRGLDRGADALDRTSEALDELADVPVVGGGVEKAAKQVGVAARETHEAAQDARRRILMIAVLIALAVIALPTVPVLLVLRMLPRQDS